LERSSAGDAKEAMANELLTTVPRPPVLRAPVEGRVHVRYNCDLPAACRPTSEWRIKEAHWPATVLDISQGGIGLVMRRRFEAGANLTIELAAGEGQEAYAVIARVVHVWAHPGGLWALGCRFLGELGDDELNRLLPAPNGPAAAAAVPTHAPAASPVAPSQAGTLILADVHLQIESQESGLQRFLVRRLTISSAQRPAPGRKLTIKIAKSGGPPRTFTAQVIGWDRGGKGEVLRCRCP
jgi:hypothetical protein